MPHILQLKKAAYPGRVAASPSRWVLWLGLLSFSTVLSVHVPLRMRIVHGIESVRGHGHS